MTVHLAAEVGGLGAAAQAWLITSLQPAGRPASKPLVSHALARLHRLQVDAGHWPSHDGDFRDADTTVEAIRAIRLCEA